MGDGFEPDCTIGLCCPACGTDAEIPFRSVPGNPVIASIGLNIIFDRPLDIPPIEILPKTIKCRTCRRVFTSIDD